MAKVTSGTDANGRTNYEGKLYDFTSTGATEMEDYGQGTESYREPANLTYSESNEGVMEDYRDYAERFTIEEIKNNWDEQYYQESFNKMVESVAKYKGFYVGRYEMSLDANGKAQSKAGKISATAGEYSANMWFGLYEKATTYSNSGVISEMIWGCQWDAMMIWMQENNIDVNSETPTDTARDKETSGNTTEKTGSSDNDILNNIYDLIGNRFEWTQEANDKYYRVIRGGYGSGPVNGPAQRLRSPITVNAANGAVGSRLAIYVEV